MVNPLHSLLVLLVPTVVALDLTPIDLVKGQLLAYNAHEVDLFCTYFAEGVVVYDGHTHEILFKGMGAFKERYTHTLSNPNLHCELLNRIEQGNVIIDTPV